MKIMGTKGFYPTAIKAVGYSDHQVQSEIQLLLKNQLMNFVYF